MLDPQEDSRPVTIQPVIRSLHHAPAINDLENVCQADTRAKVSLSQAQHEQSIACTRDLLFYPDQVSTRCICKVCGTNWPSDFYLNLHITEAHDKFFESAVEAGSTTSYCCLVRGCQKRFKTVGDRKHHLHMSHMYSAESNFPSMHLKHVTMMSGNRPGQPREACMEYGDKRMCGQAEKARLLWQGEKVAQTGRSKVRMPGFPKQGPVCLSATHRGHQDDTIHSEPSSGNESLCNTLEVVSNEKVCAWSSIPTSPHRQSSSMHNHGNDIDPINDLTTQVAKMTTTYFVPRSVQLGGQHQRQ